MGNCHSYCTMTQKMLVLAPILSIGDNRQLCTDSEENISSDKYCRWKIHEWCNQYELLPQLFHFWGAVSYIRFFWFLSLLTLFNPYTSCCLHYPHLDDVHSRQDLLHFAAIIWNLVEMFRMQAVVVVKSTYFTEGKMWSRGF